MIDVVVPVWNQFHFVAQCLDALKAQSLIGKIIVVDDGSTDERLLDYYELVDGYTLCRHSHNLGFVDAVNRGMEMVGSQYAVIVNSDTLPLSQDALHALMGAMEETGAHVAGAKLLFMPGSPYGDEYRVQHAGIGFDVDGKPYHPLMGVHRDTKAVNRFRDVSAVTGAVMGIRVSKWREIGGFDIAFAPGIYEDVDYCLKAGRVVYVPKSEWLHWMHGSRVKDGDIFDCHDDNLKLLLKRWSTVCDERIYYGV
jgi:GT2 family glycosyltransferase